MTKVIAIGALKGGVAKTMSIFNIAGILAKKGYKILCMDIDPQGNLTSDFGIDRTNPNLLGMDDIFSDNPPTLDKLIVKSPIPELPNIDAIASTVLLHKSELSIAFATAREFLLKNFMEDNEEMISKYDYVLIDTNPSLSYLNQNAFLAADKIIMPTTADTADIDGINLFFTLWDNFRSKLKKEDNIAGIFITRLDRRNNSDKEFVDFIKSNPTNKHISELLLDTIIPVNVSLKEAKIGKTPICMYNPACAGAVAYYGLVDELFDKGVL